MSITYKVKDLIQAALDHEVDVIAQQCNCFCTRKSGIAPQIDRAFPEAGEADDRTVAGELSKMGTYSRAVSMEHGTIIYNLYGQFNYRSRQDTDYDSLYKAMWEMSRQHPKGTKIGLPKIGAGLGGGDWNTIERIIYSTLGWYHDVTIYVLHRDEIPD